MGRIALQNMDVSFDENRKRDTMLYLKKAGPVKHVQYVSKFDINSESLIVSDQDEKGKIDFHEFTSEYFNTYFLAKINNIDADKTALFKEKVSKILQDIKSRHFQGYKVSIMKFIETIELSDADPKESFFQYLEELQDNILPNKIKIENLPADGFRDSLMTMLEKVDPFFMPFKIAMSAAQEQTNLNGEELKKDILQYLSDMRVPLTRRYRSDATKKHYISYIHADLINGIISEVGFSYISYREFIHPAASKFILILLLVVLFIIIGFRIFFSGALLKPLDTLLSGLKQVGKGNIDISLRVFVEDEIGFMTRSFNSMVRAIKAGELKLQRYAAGLERKVKERTIKLSESLEAVQLLKDQQDGDYFLTSLIIKPLSPNRAKSEYIRCEFLLEQKKKFIFRHWSSDIGGDLCISDNIVLNSSPYVVFLNGDAMGKSLQGAGGALVLGAAFQSVLERSKLSSDMKKQSPERWLKNSFREMHSIFESFDGSMMISAVIGLIEENTGLMYFINAEHPWTVLYRDAKADFIEKDSFFRKLGSAIGVDSLFVQTFQLMHGDVIIAGSDGRDDLVLGVDDKGNRIINEDEMHFLSAVEEGDADLPEVVRVIKSKGELMDDLSLLKIEYSNPESLSRPEPELESYLQEAVQARMKRNIRDAIKTLMAAGKEIKEHPRILKELFKNFLLEKNYKDAVQYGTKYSKKNPRDTQSLFALSYALRKIGDYNSAIDYGERVRSRKRSHENNLANLAECYFRINLYKRSLKIAEETLKQNSDNIKAARIIADIRERQPELFKV
jgi:methyl-accepting chemotaxis protein